METRIVKDRITRSELENLAHEQYRDVNRTPVSKERWQALSFAQQFGNIGSEVGRAAKWQGRDENSFWGAVIRALELFDLTQADRRWGRRRHEINRAKETFADAVLGGHEYKSNLKDLEKYFMLFALFNAKKAVLDV